MNEKWYTFALKSWYTFGLKKTHLIRLVQFPTLREHLAAKAALRQFSPSIFRNRPTSPRTSYRKINSKTRAKTHI